MKHELPTKDAWAVDFSTPYRPFQPAPSLPDRREITDTLLVGPRGEALLVRQPRTFGFRKP